jgi:hypothetical protein
MKSFTAFAAIVVLLSGTGCITERKVTLANPVTREFAPIDRSWAIGEVFVSAEPQGRTNRVEDWSRARRELEAHLDRTLRAQPALGHRVEDRSSADVVVDVDVKLREQEGLNAWLVPVVLTSTAIVVGGAVVGAKVASQNGVDSTLGLVGGELAAFVPAAALSLLFPARQVTGTAETTLTFRRATDGVAILEKHTTTTYSAKLNGYFVEDKLSRITGVGAALLEQDLLVALHEGLVIAPDETATAAAGVVPVGDAPLRLHLLTEVSR